MRRISRLLIWLLLVPYFAVGSLGVPAWIGETEQDTNRANAQLTVALMLTSSELAVLALAGLSRGELWDKHLTLVCAALFLPAWIFVAWWVSKSREADYRKHYQGMSLGARLTFGFLAATFVASCWWVIGKA
jgi:hypothetical protein